MNTSRSTSGFGSGESGTGEGEGSESHGEGSGAVDAGRRRYLRLGGTALLAGSAGCFGFGTDEGGESDGGESDGGEDGDSPIVVTDASVSETEITTSDTVDVTGTIENRSAERGSVHTELRVDGAIIDTEQVTVDPGETESVTFTGRFQEPGEYEVGVNDTHAGTVVVELPPPEFEIVDATVDETTVEPGESVEVTATVTNVGGREGEFTAELRVDGTVVESRQTTIGADEEDDVTFTHTFDDPGEYDVDVNDTDVETVTVAPPAEFEIESTEIGETRIEVGESVEVTATVTNVGGREGEYTADLEQDGETIDSQTVTVPPEESEVASFSPTFDESGSYALSVDGVDVDTLYVLECDLAVNETVNVGSGSSETYTLDLREYDEVTITTETQDGVDPSVTVVGPSGQTVADAAADGSIQESFTVDEAGEHQVTLENGASLPWQDGTWAVEIETCTW